jgi:hypothetical protein
LTDLLDGGWQSLSRALRFGGSKTHEFSAGKGKRCRHKGAAETFEAVVECTWVMPQSETHITGIRPSTAVDASHDIDENSNETSGLSVDSTAFP